MEKRMNNAGFEVREAENEEKTIEGFFSVFGSPYDMGGLLEYVDPHAFDGALGGDIRALIDHDSAKVLGRTSAGTLELEVREQGLWGKIHINPEDTDAMNLYARVKRGDMNQCSFGFEILDEEYSWSRDAGVPDKVTIKAVKLYEVSVCTFPAYEDTVVYARAQSAQAEKERLTQAWREKLKARLNG